jgi:hypothetical protein
MTRRFDVVKVLIFGAGMATGYVLGAKAGRQRYDQIVGMTKRVAGDPRVQHGAKVAARETASVAGTVGSAAGHAAADVGSKVVDKAKDVVGKGGDEVGPITAANSTGTTPLTRQSRTGT